MGPYRESLLHDLPTVVTFLRREAWVDSSHLMTSSCSLIFKDSEELSPTGIENGFAEMMVFGHIEDIQVLNGNHAIRLGVLLGNLEMEIPSLTANLEMGLGYIASSLAASRTALLAPAQLALLASQAFLRSAIIAGVSDSLALRVSKKDFESDVYANIGMLTLRWSVFNLCFLLAGNQGIPMFVSTTDKIDRLGFAFDRSMELDLEEVSQFLGHDQVFLIFMQVTVLAVLAQLNAMPSVRRLETGEAHIRESQFFGSEEPFESFIESVCKALDRRGRHMSTSAAFKGSLKAVFAREGALTLILGLDGLQHLIVQEARLPQALHEQMSLFFIRIETVLKHSHADILLSSLEVVKWLRSTPLQPPTRTAFFTPMPSGRGTHRRVLVEKTTRLRKNSA
jgi:hypothetical protein